jgi:CMP-N-acetylneuraminic acid synthetase
MPEVLAIVPARHGSKRVARKNVRPIAGKPLVQWAIEAGLSARSISRLVVNSDDPDVLDIARSYPQALALERPAELATDTAAPIAYVRHTLQQLRERSAPEPDVVVILQPSSPFTLAEDIDATVALLLSSGAECAVSVMKLDHAVHPAKLKLLRGDRLLPYFEDERGRMASHELPEVYVRNCAVYATRRDVVERGLIVSDDSRGYVMPRERSIDINDELDLAFAEFLCARSQRGAPR